MFKHFQTIRQAGRERKVGRHADRHKHGGRQTAGRTKAVFLRLALLLPSPSAASAHSLRSVSHSSSATPLLSILSLPNLFSHSVHTHTTFLLTFLPDLSHPLLQYLSSFVFHDGFSSQLPSVVYFKSLTYDTATIRAGDNDNPEPYIQNTY